MIYYQEKNNLLKKVLLKEHYKQIERQYKYMFIRLI